MHISYLLFHGPQCTRIRTVLPHKSFSSQHACHNVPTSICSPTPHAPQCTRFYSLTNSTSVFRGSESKEIYALKKKTTACVRMHWRKRERGVYTHWSREYGNGFFSFVSERYNQILPYSYDYFGGGAYHFLILIKTTTPSNFLVFFYYIHIFFTNNNVAKNHKGKNLSLTHIHARSIVAVWSVQPHISQGSIPHTDVGAAVIRHLLLHVIVVVGGRR